MAEPLPRFRAAYGSSPQHLLVMIACFTLAGWVALRIADEATAGRMLLWFVGAAVAHDLVLFPIYASADRVLRGALGALRPRWYAWPVARCTPLDAGPRRAGADRGPHR